MSRSAWKYGNSRRVELDGLLQLPVHGMFVGATDAIVAVEAKERRGIKFEGLVFSGIAALGIAANPVLSKGYLLRGGMEPVRIHGLAGIFGGRVNGFAV